MSATNENERERRSIGAFPTPASLSRHFVVGLLAIAAAAANGSSENACQDLPKK